MRRSGTNTVGAPSTQFTLPVDVVNLCASHGGVDTFDVDTGVLFCHDGVYCNQQSMECSDNVAAAQACAAESGMVWDPKLALCVVDSTNPFTSGAAKAACQKKNGYHWDALLGCHLDQRVVSPDDPCDVGGCSGRYDGNLTCVQDDPACKPAGPAGRGNGPFPHDPCVIDGCPGEYRMQLNCVKDDATCHGGKIDTGNGGPPVDLKAQCDKTGGTYNAATKKCTDTSGGGGSSGLAIAGGLGLLALVVYAATRKKGK